MIHWHRFRPGDVLRRVNDGEGRDGQTCVYVRDADTFPIIRFEDGQEFIADFSGQRFELIKRGDQW